MKNEELEKTVTGAKKRKRSMPIKISQDDFL